MSFGFSFPNSSQASGLSWRQSHGLKDSQPFPKVWAVPFIICWLSSCQWSQVEGKKGLRLFQVVPARRRRSGSQTGSSRIRLLELCCSIHEKRENPSALVLPGSSFPTKHHLCSSLRAEHALHPCGMSPCLAGLGCGQWETLKLHVRPQAKPGSMETESLRAGSFPTDSQIPRASWA